MSKYLFKTFLIIAFFYFPLYSQELGNNSINDNSFENFINEYGNTASVISLCIVLLGFIFSFIKKILTFLKEKEKIYEEMKKEISVLSNKATTLSERQDLFMYISTRLNDGRHTELKMRYSASLMTLISIINGTTIFLSFTFNLIGLDVLILNISAVKIIIGLFLLVIISLFSMFYMISQISKMNDSIFSGYHNFIANHIEKTIHSKELK